MATPDVRVGCSGWHYDHWVGPFYPDGTRASDMLGLYAERFRAVEINNTFYSLPEAKTLKDWAGTVPEGFRFALKASRYITHMKKLKDPEESTVRFFDAIEPLGKRTGPILFQLPPNWKPNADRLDAFLHSLPRGYRYVVECRDTRWHIDAVYEVLHRHDAAFVIWDLAGTQSPMTVTADDLVYVRLHGPDDAYEGCYDDRALDDWAARIAEWRDDGKSVWCFFDNDQNGYAPQNAAALAERLGV